MTLISFRLEFVKEESGQVRIYLKGVGKDSNTNEVKEYSTDTLATPEEIARFDVLKMQFKSQFNLD